MDAMQPYEDKLDPNLRKLVDQNPTGPIKIIVQTLDGLQDQDYEIIATLGGKIKDNLKIIDAYSAELSAAAVEALAQESRVVKIYHDAEVKAIRA